MPVRAKFEIKGLDAYLETLVKAEKDVDQIVVEVLDMARPEAEEKMHEQLRKTSELWTGETDATIRVSVPQQDGNYVFIELGAGSSGVPQAMYKEFGTTRQAAEPFLRPALTELRRSGLKRMMKQVLERFGLPTT